MVSGSGYARDRDGGARGSRVRPPRASRLSCPSPWTWPHNAAAGLPRPAAGHLPRSAAQSWNTALWDVRRMSREYPLFQQLPIACHRQAPRGWHRMHEPRSSARRRASVSGARRPDVLLAIVCRSLPGTGICGQGTTLAIPASPDARHRARWNAVQVAALGVLIVDDNWLFLEIGRAHV